MDTKTYWFVKIHVHVHVHVHVLYMYITVLIAFLDYGLNLFKSNQHGVPKFVAAEAGSGKPQGIEEVEEGNIDLTAKQYVHVHVHVIRIHVHVQ